MRLALAVVGSTTGQRMHIEVFREKPVDEMKAAIVLQENDPETTDTRLFATDTRFKILFGDQNNVLLERSTFFDGEDMFDVFVNQKLAHTCMYRNVQEGVLLHIFKEDDLIKVAQSSASYCYNAVYEKEEFDDDDDVQRQRQRQRHEKPRYKPSRLR